MKDSVNRNQITMFGEDILRLCSSNSMAKSPRGPENQLSGFKMVTTPTKLDLMLWVRRMSFRMHSEICRTPTGEVNSSKYYPQRSRAVLFGWIWNSGKIDHGGPG